MATVMTRLTPEDVLDMLNRGELAGKPFELVDGEIVWLSASHLYEARVTTEFVVAVAGFGKSIGALAFESSAGFTVGPDRRQLRSPDVSLVVKERIHLMNFQGWGGAAPDLAVEVLSQGEYGEAYARVKVPEYLGSGGKVVWLADPRRRTIREYIAEQDNYKLYGPEDEITLDPIAPGFRAVVGSFFPARD